MKHALATTTTTTTTSRRPVGPWISYVSGMSSGVAACAIGHPFDTLRINLQTIAPASTSTPLRNSSTIHLAKTLYSQGGIGRLYQGLGPQLCHSVVAGSLLFGLYHQNKSTLISQHTMHPNSILWKHFTPENTVKTGGAAGFLTGAMLAGMYAPLDLVKCRQQTTSTKSSSVVPTVSSIVRSQIKNHGLPSLFTGLSATFVRQSIGNIFFFGTYEYCKTIFSDKNSLSPIGMMASGSAAGSTFWTLVYPIDVVKSHVQICPKRRGYRYYTLKILRSQGVAGFFRGFAVTLFRSIPVSGTSILVYELVSSSLLENTII